MEKNPYKVTQQYYRNFTKLREEGVIKNEKRKIVYEAFAIFMIAIIYLLNNYICKFCFFFCPNGCKKFLDNQTN